MTSQTASGHPELLPATCIFSNVPAMTMNKENLNQVQEQMVAKAQQKIGAAKTAPAAIQHSLFEVGCLNLVDL
jgi:hypothetical protein